MIEWIKIKNFKCFDEFETKGFNRINLIGGKNNVGKTALMEALCINSYSNDFQTFFTALTIPEITRYNKYPSIEKLIEKYNYFKIDTNIHQICLKVTELNSITSYKIEIDNQILDENKKLIDFKQKTKDNISFIDLSNLNFERLKNYYKYIQLADKEEYLNKLINSFDKEIEEFKFIDDEAMLKKNGKYFNLNEFGDGIKRFIFVILGLFKAKDGFLFIDEIENGIHYSKLDSLFELIFNLSKTNNIQVFISTHSKECIESYAKVAKKLNDKNITFIELIKNNDIKAMIYPYEWFIDEIEQNHEVRG